MQEILLVLVILLIFIGPQKLPEIAKELGGAVREFKKASFNLDKMSKNILTAEENEQDQNISEIARKLKININGKTNKQLLNEITTKIDNKKNE